MRVYSGEHPTALELCDASGGCRYADGTLDGDSVVIAIPAGFQPVRVRHGWADSPVVTLFDGAGRPAASFTLPME